jgi:hypothetical protein
MTIDSVADRLRTLILAVGVSLLASPALAEKTDIVVLLNGDHLTGEVKRLRYGQLMFATDNMGTVYIEWDKIASISTTRVLQVEMADGSRHVGRLPSRGSGPGIMRLAPIGAGEDQQATDLPMVDIVRADYLQQGKWLSRLEGAVSAGYSFTQASNVQQLNFAGNVGSRDRKRRWDLAIDTQTTGQESGPSSERAALAGTWERFMRNRYYYEGTLEFTRNRELGLDLRSLLGGTVGRYIAQNQGREWRAGAGLAASREERSDGTSSDNLEAQLATSLRLFRYDSPKRDITANINLLPSLTDKGRVRGEASIDARFEIISDLFFKISLFDSYDNQPPEGSATNDWSVVSSLEYSF